MEALAAASSAAIRMEEPDTRNRLSHILATDPEPETPAPTIETPLKPQEAAPTNMEEDNANGELTPAGTKEDADMEQASTAKGRFSEIPIYTATTTTTRRNANG
ncbi:hypothetical protein LTS18_004465, partial [Coniosporium uncinatum]